MNGMLGQQLSQSTARQQVLLESIDSLLVKRHSLKLQIAAVLKRDDRRFVTEMKHFHKPPIGVIEVVLALAGIMNPQLFETLRGTRSADELLGADLWTELWKKHKEALCDCAVELCSTSSHITPLMLTLCESKISFIKQVMDKYPSDVMRMRSSTAEKIALVLEAVLKAAEGGFSEAQLATLAELQELEDVKLPDLRRVIQIKTLAPPELRSKLLKGHTKDFVAAAGAEEFPVLRLLLSNKQVYSSAKTAIMEKLKNHTSVDLAAEHVEK